MPPIHGCCWSFRVTPVRIRSDTTVATGLLTTTHNITEASTELTREH